MEVRNNVVNLYVKRQERVRDVEEGRLIWVCSCGCNHFYLYDDTRHEYRLRCVKCDKWNIPRSFGGRGV